MKGFKEKSFSERCDMAAKAKKAALQKFGEKPSADDPAERERRADKKAIVAAREARAVTREEERLAKQLRLDEEKAQQVVAEEQEVARMAERNTAVEKEQKAARDARYAARKAQK